jgi:hypothetical protein
VEEGLDHYSQKRQDSWQDWFEYNSHNFVYDILPYSVWMGILNQVVFYVGFFIRKYNDLFLMLHGRALTARFKQFNKWLQKVLIFLNLNNGLVNFDLFAATNEPRGVEGGKGTLR